jgi:translocation and assembly module TamA
VNPARRLSIPFPPHATLVTTTRALGRAIVITLGVVMAWGCAPAAADVAVEAYRVEVVAPAPIKAAVERSLDLVRWQSYAEITPEFFDLLVADARAQARDVAAAQGYFSAAVTSDIDRSTTPETVRLRIEPGEPTTVASVELLVTGAAALGGPEGEDDDRPGGEERLGFDPGEVFQEDAGGRGRLGHAGLLTTCCDGGV